jgi:hypothetical protein
VERSGRNLTKVLLSRYLYGGTEENHESPHSRQCHGRDSNRAFPEDKSEGLKPEANYSVL